MQGGLRFWGRKPTIWSWMESSGLHQGLATPEVGPLALLFCVLVVSVLCRIFVRCIPPTLVSVPVQNLKTKYSTNKKGTLPDWNPGSSNLIILK